MLLRQTYRSLQDQIIRRNAPIYQQLWNARFLSDGSHSDFAAQRKSIPDTDDAVRLIQQHVKEHDIMLYMKGKPKQPACGFSLTVVDILNKEGVDFSSVNVMDYPAIREGIKKFSQWPTM